MTTIETFVCDQLKEKTMTTRQLWTAARKEYGNHVVNVRLASPVVLTYDLVREDLERLARAGVVQSRGVPPEWRLR